MENRSYEQRLRAETAAQTRRRILESLCAHLRRTPSERVAVDRVARDAGVSRSTVYLIFGDRGGLFDAVGTDLLERGGFADVLTAVEDANAGNALRQFLRATVGMYAANRDVLRTLYSMAQLDPDTVGGAITRMEAGRLFGVQQIAARFGLNGDLRDGVTVEDAADILWLTSSFDGFDLLFHRRGRDVESVAELLIRCAAPSILRA
ncbi:MAG: TetR/AcrR family transcriptional regulator [Thermoleophilia bacterium]|nr:TetR/AcrR family transcriptional regulator [Thermoleophilia bacterium]